MYVVLGANDVSLYVVAPAAVVAMRLNDPLAPLARSTWNPVSFEEFRVQVSVIDEADVDAAARPVGAAGTVGGGGVVVVSGGVVVLTPPSELPPQAARYRIDSSPVAVRLSE